MHAYRGLSFVDCESKGTPHLGYIVIVTLDILLADLFG